MIKGNTPVWSDPASIEAQLPQLVSAAHKKNVKVLTSIGGWTGSLTFRYGFNPSLSLILIRLFIAPWPKKPVLERNSFTGVFNT